MVWIKDNIITIRNLHPTWLYNELLCKNSQLVAVFYTEFNHNGSYVAYLRVRIYSFNAIHLFITLINVVLLPIILDIDFKLFQVTYIESNLNSDLIPQS